MLRDERGELSLTQLLVSMTIFMFILGATLTTFTAFNDQERKVEQRNDSQDQARNVLDRLSRDLRNLANPTSASPQAIDKATVTDLVFQNVDAVGPNAGSNSANARRVRYCLNTTTSPDDATLWFQSQTWTTATPPSAPSTTNCPDAAWGNQTQAVQHVTNYKTGQSRPLFVYNAAQPTDISAVHMDVFLDSNIRRTPGETKLSSGVFLRNQNRRPTATFTANPTTSGIVFNGSASIDPEGAVLKYYWYDGTQPSTTCPPASSGGTITEAGYIGSGITFTFGYPAGHSATYNLYLKVCDSSGLGSVSTVSTVTQ